MRATSKHIIIKHLPMEHHSVATAQASLPSFVVMNLLVLRNPATLPTAPSSIITALTPKHGPSLLGNGNICQPTNPRYSACSLSRHHYCLSPIPFIPCLCTFSRSLVPRDAASYHANFCYVAFPFPCCVSQAQNIKAWLNRCQHWITIAVVLQKPNISFIILVVVYWAIHGRF